MAQQLKQAYVFLLSSQFQGYCRDLHTECVDYLVQSITPTQLRTACRNALTQDRKLDRGNPDHGNLGADFGRLVPTFWAEVDRVDPPNPRGPTSKDSLDGLRACRNAVAHQDFSPSALALTTLRLPAVRAWHRACERLAGTFDEVMRQHIQSVNGFPPW